MDVPSPFDVLGLAPDADDEDLKEAYRERVLETHPDHGGSTEAFRRVREAYERIKAEEWNEAEAPADKDQSPERTAPVVEYLDYEVVDEHGWAIDDENLFERAAEADLAPSDHGRFTVAADQTLLQAAENHGFEWPYACRGGACANCAVAVLEGDLSMPVDHILPGELAERGIQLSCVGTPATPELKVVFNVKHLPDLDDLRLPPHPFERANRGD